jgi:superfamily II DNA/RNA helicase
MPALRHIQAQRKAAVLSSTGHPVFICVAPTRELAQQIADVLRTAGRLCGYKACCVFGGMPKYVQAKELRGGVEMVVGTPGRMLDLMQDGTLHMDVRTIHDPRMAA